MRSQDVNSFLREQKTVLIGLLLLLLIGLFMYGTSAERLESWQVPRSYPEVQELTGTTWTFQQYQDYFKNLAQQKGGVYAFEVLKRAPFPAGIDLHLLAHVVGDVLYAQKGIDAIKYCDAEFRNACSHSVVIGILNEHGEGSMQQIASTCKEAPGGKGAYGMCFHGLGHGVLAYTGYELPRAIHMCKMVGTAEYRNREYVECVGGTIMEMIAGVHDRQAWEVQQKKYFKASDPLYPCNADFVPGDVKSICYIHLTPHLFTSAGGDLGNLTPPVYEKAFSFCSALPKSDEEWRAACYSGFGKEFTVIAQQRDIRNIGGADETVLRTIRSWCSLSHDYQGERACNGSALSSLYWGGENEIDAALTFCRVAEGDAQFSCYEQLAFLIGYYGRNDHEVKTRCALLPDSYQSQCRLPRAK